MGGQAGEYGRSGQKPVPRLAYPLHQVLLKRDWMLEVDVAVELGGVEPLELHVEIGDAVLRQ